MDPRGRWGRWGRCGGVWLWWDGWRQGAPQIGVSSKRDSPNFLYRSNVTL